MIRIPLAICAAYLLDLMLGDPQFSWHPVRIIGRLIKRMEIILNTGRLNKKLSGVLLIILVVAATVICVYGLLKLSALIHPVLRFIVYTILIYFALAIKSLGVEANNVYAALADRDIVRAREGLSMIVARDTGHLEEPEVIRATVETVAESTMDGVISPLFFAFLGGPVLVWAYKAINTLDSMVGYKNERFADFGWAAAKIDAMLNFIPAKITCFAILTAGYYCKNIKGNPAQCIKKYFFKGPQYNSESTEATMASLLGIQLGGVNFYNSAAVEKNIIGERLYPLEIKHIKESIKIAYTASGLSLAAGMLLFGGR